MAPRHCCASPGRAEGPGASGSPQACDGQAGALRRRAAAPVCGQCRRPCTPRPAGAAAMPTSSDTLPPSDRPTSSCGAAPASSLRIKCSTSAAAASKVCGGCRSAATAGCGVRAKQRTAGASRRHLSCTLVHATAGAVEAGPCQWRRRGICLCSWPCTFEPGGHAVGAQVHQQTAHVLAVQPGGGRGQFTRESAPVPAGSQQAVQEDGCQGLTRLRGRGQGGGGAGVGERPALPGTGRAGSCRQAPEQPTRVQTGLSLRWRARRCPRRPAWLCPAPPRVLLPPPPAPAGSTPMRLARSA